MNIRPLEDFLVVRRLEDEPEPGRRIVIPDIAKKKSMRGVVVAVSEGKTLKSGKLRPLTVKVGDEVLFDPDSGLDVRIENEMLLIFRETDIIAICL